jgi:hypothetical protein
MLRLIKQFRDYMSMYVSESELPPLMAISQLFVINS